MILIDTNVFIAYYNSRDTCHQKAEAILHRIQNGTYGPAVITDYIFDEAVTVCMLRAGKSAALELGSTLMQAFPLIKVSDDIFHHAWTIFHESTELSFTDCTNLSVVKEFSISTIATFDKEFKKHRQITIVDN